MRKMSITKFKFFKKIFFKHSKSSKSYLRSAFRCAASYPYTIKITQKSPQYALNELYFKSFWERARENTFFKKCSLGISVAAHNSLSIR